MAYRLTHNGVQVALLLLFFQKRRRGPLTNSCFHHKPDPEHRSKSRLEAAYHKTHARRDWTPKLRQGCAKTGGTSSLGLDNEQRLFPTDPRWMKFW